jgi:hypothetical protein
MAREQYLAMKGPVAALNNPNLDCAERFVGVVVRDEAGLKHGTAVIQERCIPQKLVHPPNCRS